MLKFIKFFMKRNKLYAMYLNDKFEIIEKSHIYINKLYPLDTNRQPFRLINNKHESTNSNFY
jgi:hypothetical protein